RIQSAHLVSKFSGNGLISVEGDFAAGQFPDINSLMKPDFFTIPLGTNVISKHTDSRFPYLELVYRYSNDAYVVVLARSPGWDKYLFSFFKLAFYWSVIFVPFIMIFHFVIY